MIMTIMLYQYQRHRLYCIGIKMQLLQYVYKISGRYRFDVVSQILYLARTS